MVISMDGMERERVCISYLESLGVSDSGNILLTGHKYLINVDNEDSFHQIADVTGTSKIANFDGDLNFELSIPSNANNDTWFVFLSRHRKIAFLNKYIHRYSIQR